MAARKPQGEIVAVVSFYAYTKTGERLVEQGAVVAAGDPVVKGREHLFTPKD